MLICALISNRRSWLMSLETPVLLPPSSQNHVCHPPQQATGLKLGRVPWKSRLLEIIRKTCFFLKNSRVAQGSVLHSDCLLVLKTHRDGFAFFWGGKIYKMITETHFFFLIFPHIRCASRYISRFIHGFKKAIDKWEKVSRMNLKTWKFTVNHNDLIDFFSLNLFFNFFLFFK